MRHLGPLFGLLLRRTALLRDALPRRRGPAPGLYLIPWPVEWDELERWLGAWNLAGRPAPVVMLADRVPKWRMTALERLGVSGCVPLDQNAAARIADVISPRADAPRVQRAASSPSITLLGLPKRSPEPESLPWYSP